MWKKFGLGSKWNLKDLMKTPDKNRLLIFLLIGILLVVIALPTSPKTTDNAESMQAETLSSDSLTDYESYEASLERKLEQVLEQVAGVGKVNVMITLKSTGEKVVEKDTQTSSQTIEEEDSAGGSRTTKDQSSGKTSVYAQSSEGEQSPYVSKEMTPEVQGIMIVAEGGDDPVVVQNITEAAQALFGIEAHKIKIMKRES